jgi:hypothetical protein
MENLCAYLYTEGGDLERDCQTMAEGRRAAARRMDPFKICFKQQRSKSEKKRGRGDPEIPLRIPTHLSFLP